MKLARPLTSRTGLTASAALAFFCLAVGCLGQGTMTFTFEGQPSGTVSQGLAYYVESGMRFSVLAPGGIYLSGGGMPGYPDDGTGYLESPDGSPGSGGLSFEPNQPFPASFAFNLVSLDGAVYDGEGPKTLEVVGFHPMAGTVTNYFTVDFQFQTFDLSSSFTNVFQVEILNAPFSLDNVVISGVPEPSVGGLVALATLSALGWVGVRRWGLSRAP